MRALPGISPSRRPGFVIIGAAALALTLGACGGGGAKAGTGGSQPSATTAQPSGTAAPSSNPNAPEVNPSGDIPDNQVYVAYTPTGGGFSVKVPEGWARSEPGGAATFTDKLNRIRMETVAAPTAPTVQSAQQQELPALQAATRNLQGAKVTSVTRKAGPAVLITYRADSAPDPVTGKVGREAVERYEFWRAGREVVLTLSGPQGADNVDPWRIVTDSFAWQP